MNKNMKISIVVPCYNEEENLVILYQRICEILTGFDYEITFIDDGSKDNTLSNIITLSEQDEKVKYISFSRNFGHQNALKAGLDLSSGDCVISLDADLQHPPELIPEMIEKWINGFDIIFTIRSDTDISFMKRITSRLFYKFTNLFSDIKISQGTADFRLMDRKVVDVFKKDFQENFLFIRGLIPWVGFKQTTINYLPNRRFKGKSKYTFFKMLNFAINGITSLSMKPLRIATFIGFVFSFFSFIYIFYALFIFFFTNKAIHGWTSVIFSVLFIGGIQLIILGIIGEYIGKMFFEIKKRPNYIIDKTNIP
jgi:polyisoprenyl-phosphate glycosyltransferase